MESFRRRIQQQSFTISTIRMFALSSFSILLLAQSSLVLLVPYCNAFTITTTKLNTFVRNLQNTNNDQQQQCIAPKSNNIPHSPRVAAGHSSVRNPATNLFMSLSLSSNNNNEQQQQTPKDHVVPQAFSSGYSTNVDLVVAIKEAFEMARSGLPSTIEEIDMVWVSISSLYDGGGSIPGTSATPTVTVPIVLAAAQGTGIAVKNIIGSTVAGCISSQVSTTIPPSKAASEDSTQSTISCQTVELESIPSVSITLGVLPETKIITFQISAPDLPDHEDDVQLSSAKEWKRSLGLSQLQSVYDKTDTNSEGSKNNDVQPTSFFVLPSPSFTTNQIQMLLGGINKYFPNSQIAGGIASTVSSLSRARLFQWTARKSGGDTSTSCYSDGCVGVAFQGDVKWQTLQALGAKPVGGVYQIVAGQDSTIKLIQLDEAATETVKAEEAQYDNGPTDEDDDDDQEEEDTSETLSAKEAMAKFYAKALIPKPVLAEANFLMRTLSDDDQAFMRRQLLVGLEDYGSGASSTSASSRIASELARLAAGEGHRFRVYTVASAGMKDGSVTLPLVSNVQIYKGQRLRFFVREPDFATKEINALWLGYQQRMLNEQFSATTATKSMSTSATATAKVPFKPGACFIIPTLDRGNKFFQGQKSGYESLVASQKLTNVQSISGFFSNGVVGSVMDFATSSTATGDARTRIGVQGSASGYFLLGSWSGRPVYSAAEAAVADAAAAAAATIDSVLTIDGRNIDAEIARKPRRGVTATVLDRSAPRAENGELILKRREVHSGRALTVSTVEWSVAEKTARPSSTLEGFMWEKETEVDRFRERVPLANLLSQCRLSVADPTSPKPRDWVGPVKQAIATSENKFVIIPECKRIDPATTGSIRRRYDVTKIVRDFTVAGVPALSVNCDGVLFGGSLDHITAARSESSIAAIETINSIDNDGVLVPPILASDLLLYPYQLYKLRLAGADAVNIIVGALEQKDLLYLSKIASSVQLQVLATVTSEVQLQTVLNFLPANSLQGVILSNRELEDFSFDETGEQVLRLLQSPTLHKLKEKYGGDNNLLVLVEGRVGLIERNDAFTGSSSITSYIKELKAAGAVGAIIGAGLASTCNAKELQELLSSFQAA